MKDLFEFRETFYCCFLPLPLARSTLHKHRFLMENNWKFSHSLSPYNNTTLYYKHYYHSPKPITINSAYTKQHHYMHRLRVLVRAIAKQSVST